MDQPNLTDNRAQLTEALKAHGGLLIGVGILFCVLGVLAMLAPLQAGVSVAIVVGIMVLIGGIGQCLFAFQARSVGFGIVAFLLGALTVICAALMISHPLFGVKFLTLLLAIYFVAEGIGEIIFAIQVRHASGWVWLLVSGICSLVLGGLIFSEYPLSGAWAIGILVGIKLLFTGGSMLSLGIAARQLAKV